MRDEVVELAQQLIAIQSESLLSNATISDFLQKWLEKHGLAVERICYIDPNGVEKVNLIAQMGEGTGGLGFFSHSDTVPGDGAQWQPFNPRVEDGKLYGRGSCDMKGPLAASMIAVAGIDASKLRRPLYIAIAADEEMGHVGAHHIQKESATFKQNWPTWTVIPEPTEMLPVYAHKGGALITVTATGRAAHTSLDTGISANFLIAPFLAEMAELAKRMKSEERYKNHEFDPPTNGFNLTIDDGGCATNVTAAKCVAKVNFRIMPNDLHEEIIAQIEAAARRYGLAITHRKLMPFIVPKDAPIVQAACRAVNAAAMNVPFGTEAESYQRYTQCVVLGPGGIGQAHTVNEFVRIDQLEQAVTAFQRIITELCM